MPHPSASSSAEVFISYSSRDRDRVLEIAGHLKDAGVSCWLDQKKILGGANYGPEIVTGIKNCKVLMLICSDSSLRSKNVKQEIQLAWKYDRPYLPLLLEGISFPEQLQYWLEGWQWIEVMDKPSGQWAPEVLQSLARAGVHCGGIIPSPAEGASIIKTKAATGGLEGLRSLAGFSDQIWPVPAERVQRGLSPRLRGLGAPQTDALHGFRLDSRVSLAIESDCEGHLILLDEGPEGIVYCLCPSWFASDTSLGIGRTYLPQPGSRYDSFVVSGKPGREHLLAIITDDPLGFEWLPQDPKIPARVLSGEDTELLLSRLHDLEGNRWTALSTYFDVLP